MSDWHKCTPEEEALLRNPVEGQVCVLLHGQVQRMPGSHVAYMYVEAIREATRDALDQLGVKYTLQTDLGTQGLGYRFQYLDGIRAHDPEYDFDMAESVMHADVELTDGRKARGSAFLNRPRPH